MHRMEAENLQFNLRLANCFLPQREFFPLEFERISQLFKLSCTFLADFNVVFVQNSLKGLNSLVSVWGRKKQDSEIAHVFLGKNSEICFTSFHAFFFLSLNFRLKTYRTSLSPLQLHWICAQSHYPSTDKSWWCSSSSLLCVKHQKRENFIYTHKRFLPFKTHILSSISTSFCFLNTSISLLYRSIVSYLSCIFSSKFCLR